MAIRTEVSAANIDMLKVVDYEPGAAGKVSIVLPVYNQAAYLADAIDGVIEQTFADWELIIVNDGSTDGVEQVLSRYANHPRISIVHQANQKLPKALNNGFARAKGEFYTWTSADNIMLPNQIERLVAYLREHPDVAMVYSDYQAIDDADRPLNDPSFRPHNQDPQDRSLMRLPHEVTEANLHDSGDNFIGASFMYRRDAAWFIGDYAVDTFGGEDYDYWLRMSNFFRIGHVDEILYKYRVHGNTLNARAAELNIFKRVQKVLKRDAKLRHFLRENSEMLKVSGLADARRRLSQRGILVYDYSRGYTWWEARRSLFRRPFRVCLVDAPMSGLDTQELSRADLIVTSDPDCFARLHPAFGGRVVCFDVAAQPELMTSLALYRCFLWQNTGH